MSEKLEKCPFCGGEAMPAEVEQIEHSGWVGRIECGTCDAVFSLQYSTNSPGKAGNEVTAAWNRRELESASQLGGREADRRDAEAYRRINTPEIADFLSAVHNEALHQRERWGAQGDAGKTDADWFWLLGYLGGKAMRAETVEKVLHHIITTAAACLNWHAARVGHYVDMRPGIAAPSAGNGGAKGDGN